MAGGTVEVVYVYGGASFDATAGTTELTTNKRLWRFTPPDRFDLVCPSATCPDASLPAGRYGHTAVNAGTLFDRLCCLLSACCRLSRRFDF